MKYRQFRILQAVSFMTNIPTYSHKGHAASTSGAGDSYLFMTRRRL